MAELRANGEFATATYLRTAEATADSAVDTAETSDTLCRSLRETPGAHQGFLYAIETPEAHEKNKPEKDLSDLLERTTASERAANRRPGCVTGAVIQTA